MRRTKQRTGEFCETSSPVITNSHKELFDIHFAERTSTLVQKRRIQIQQHKCTKSRNDSFNVSNTCRMSRLFATPLKYDTFNPLCHSPHRPLITPAIEYSLSIFVTCSYGYGTVCNSIVRIVKIKEKDTLTFEPPHLNPRRCYHHRHPCLYFDKSSKMVNNSSASSDIRQFCAPRTNLSSIRDVFE